MAHISLHIQFYWRRNDPRIMAYVDAGFGTLVRISESAYYSSEYSFQCVAGGEL